MRILSYLVLILATACTLSTAAPAAPSTPINLNDIPAEATEEPVLVINTEEPAEEAAETAEPVANDKPSSSQPVQVIPNCLPRNDWSFTYRVVAGDTLTKIAQRGNTTASALAIGNCLTNANVIAVGQVLRVPHPVTAPLPPTAQPQPNDPQEGFVYVSSSISGDAGHLMLLRDEVVTLRWDNPPANLFMASFVVQSPSGVQTQIGADTNPGDGVSLSWKVPGGLQGSLFAIGRFLNSNFVVTSFPTGVGSAPPYGQGCELTAAPGTTIAAYNQPDLNSGVFLSIPSGDFHEELGRSLNGWFAVMPPGDGPYTVDRLRWIPYTGNLRGRGNCPANVPAYSGSPGTNTYTNAQIGFALDYPGGWSQHDGGNYVDFVSTDGRALEILFGDAGTGRTPAEEAAACIESPLCIGDRKILLQQAMSLPDGLNGYRLELSASLTKPDTTPAVYVFTVINNRSLVFRGFSQTTPTFFDNSLNSLRLLEF